MFGPFWDKEHEEKTKRKFEVIFTHFPLKKCSGEVCIIDLMFRITRNRDSRPAPLDTRKKVCWCNAIRQMAWLERAGPLPRGTKSRTAD